MTNTTAAAKTAAAPIMNNCLCGQFEVVVREWTEGNGQPEIETETTGCDATTAREFAAGHDAKLKSLLIRAGIAGHAVRQGDITSDAEKAAAQFAFAYMVRDGIARGRAKAAAQAERKANRKTAAPKRDKATQAPRKVGVRVVAAITAAEANEPQAPAAPAAIETVEVKVGRWTYLATIDAKGDAHYTTKGGDAAVAVKGVYKTV